MHRRRAPPPLTNPQAAHTIHLLQTFESSANPSRPIRPSPLTTQNGIPLDLLDRLRSFPLFQSAPESFLSAVATHLRPQLHSPRDYILTEGDSAKAMYWLVRGAVAVTSRDGESTYAELRPGAFFGEIAVLMDCPRTATIVARSRCLLVVLTKEALQRELPRFPEVERAIREEAEERLEMLRKKKEESRQREVVVVGRGVKRGAPEDGGGGGGIKWGPTMEEQEMERQGGGMEKKSKVKATGLTPGGHWASASALGNVAVNIRQVLMELPLFSGLPKEGLHFLGLSAVPRSWQPFENIIEQRSEGREIFFIVRGEVEVVDEADPLKVRIKARLKKGQYFGEVAALSLAATRTATVRSVTAVECLVISSEVLNELWVRSPPEIKAQMMATAKTRLDDGVDHDGDHTMMDTPSPTQTTFGLTPTVAITRPKSPGVRAPDAEPFDPDPYVPDFEHLVRSKSRRGSLAPPQPSPPASSPTEEKPPTPQKALKHSVSHSPPIPDYPVGGVKKIRITTASNQPSRFNTGLLPDNLLLQIFRHLPLHQLMRLRSVCTHWSRLLHTSPTLLQTLDLSRYNRCLTDHAVISIIAPFVGPRPTTIDISNCFHLSDAAFTSLAHQCGHNVIHWKMKSVWDVTAPAILDMSTVTKRLVSIDLSNCRKVSDTLLQRIIGWVVPHPHPSTQFHPPSAPPPSTPLPPIPSTPPATHHNPPVYHPPPGTIIGLPNLSSLTLSYCKHITDRTLHHLSLHTSTRLRHLNLTRCTSITDLGFQSWSLSSFPHLTHLTLADCTYLTDTSIVYLCNAAPNLLYLDLSFCCALSDTAVEVLSLRCGSLRWLDLSFCGSAVGDGSLRAVGMHLEGLRGVRVRGCVRVTGVGVESVVKGCVGLGWCDVSQCRNLRGWLKGGGRERVEAQRSAEGRRGIKWVTVQGEGGGGGYRMGEGEGGGWGDDREWSDDEDEEM